MRTEPIKNTPKNSIRKLYLTQRAAFYEALMGGIILVPEGQYDFEWFALWQRLAQSFSHNKAQFDLKPTTVLPTSDSSVGDSFREMARFRPDAVPVVDGDPAGASYLEDLLKGSPAPAHVICYGQDAGVERLSAWILEPSLAEPGPAAQALLDGSAATLRNLQDALIAKKKDRELRENAVWECIDLDECCIRACRLFHDFGAIAFDETPANAGWTASKEGNGTTVHVASHIQRASP